MGGPIKIGSVTIDTIGQLKVGSSNVQQAYVGSVLVFPATTTTTTTTTLAPTTTTTTTLAPTTTTSTTSTTTTLSYVTFTLAYSTVSGPTACSDYPTLNTSIYYAALGSTLTTGTIIYTDSNLTTPAPNGFYSNGANYWNTGAGAGNLQNQTSCGLTTTSTTTTTTAAPTTTTTTTTTLAPTTTTSTTTTTTTLGCECHDGTINDNNAFSYYDCNGVLFAAGAELGSPICYNINAPHSANITDDGISTICFCGVPTTTSTTSTTTTATPTTSTTTTTTTSAPSLVTIFWNTSEVGSGAVRLVITDSTSAVIVDEESQGSGPTNGSITTSNTPFTVAVSRAAGTEVAQYRICNDSNNTEVTHNYSVTSTDTYVVDPTPLTTTIFATYGNSNTPTNCSVA